MDVKIVIADENTMFRKCLRFLIEKQTDMKVVGEACNGRTTVHQILQMRPDIVITDIDMPDLNGIDLIHAINVERPYVKIIALTASLDLQVILELFRAGISSYLTKNCSFDDIELAVNAVMDNKTYLCPESASVAIRNFVNQSAASDVPAFSLLTKKEKKMFQLIAEGKSKKQISAHLNISGKAVELCRRQLMEKINLPNLLALTKYAIREGLIPV